VHSIIFLLEILRRWPFDFLSRQRLRIFSEFHALFLGDGNIPHIDPMVDPRYGSPMDSPSLVQVGVGS
jgi:hypothetical protein